MNTYIVDGLTVVASEPDPGWTPNGDGTYSGLQGQRIKATNDPPHARPTPQQAQASWEDVQQLFVPQAGLK